MTSHSRKTKKGREKKKKGGKKENSVPPKEQAYAMRGGTRASRWGACESGEDRGRLSTNTTFHHHEVKRVRAKKKGSGVKL